MSNCTCAELVELDGERAEQYFELYLVTYVMSIAVGCSSSSASRATNIGSWNGRTVKGDLTLELRQYTG